MGRLDGVSRVSEDKSEATRRSLGTNHRVSQSTCGLLAAFWICSVLISNVAHNGHSRFMNVIAIMLFLVDPWRQHRIRSQVIEEKIRHKFRQNASLSAGASEELAGPPEVPIRRGDRLPTLDALRGLALLGLLPLNIYYFAGVEALYNLPKDLAKPALTGWHAPLDWAIVAIDWCFLEGRMRGLFSLLFGAGVILLSERLARRSGEARARVIYFRRNLWLAFFGLFHGVVIWFGDILFNYAAPALVFLYPLRRWRARALIAVGLLIALAGGSIGRERVWHVRETLHNGAEVQTAREAGAAATPEQKALLAQTAMQSQKAALARAQRLGKGRLGYMEGWSYRLKVYEGGLSRVYSSLEFLEWTGMMILGMGLYKAGFLTNRRPHWEYVAVAVAGYVLYLPLTLFGLWKVYRSGLDDTVFTRWMLLPYSAEVLAGTLANLSVCLLLMRSGRLSGIFRSLSHVGRMAFSNYIIMSVLCQFLFAWGPWALFGRLEFYQWYLVVAGVWCIHLLFSRVWLRFFAFGPLEWAWRSLTYWKRQPLRLSPEHESGLILRQHK